MVNYDSTHSGVSIDLAITNALAQLTGSVLKGDTVTPISGNILTLSASDKTSVTGDLHISTTGKVLRFPDGTTMSTAAATATGMTSTTDLNFASDSDNNGSGDTIFATSATERLRIAASTGLFTFNSVSMIGIIDLTITGDIKIGSSAASTHQINVNASDGSIALFEFQGSASSIEIISPGVNQMKIATGTSDSLVIATAGSDAITIDASQNILLTADIYNVAWTDYGGTSTIVGWASFTRNIVRYKKIGKLVFVSYEILGVSNATNVTFTLPHASFNERSFRSFCQAQDNGTTAVNPGMASLAANSAIVTVFLNSSEAVWTNSGNKSVHGEFWYETA